MELTIDQIVAQSRASQNKVELKKVLTFVGEIKPKVIVEIGAWRGWSMEDWQRGFTPDILVGVENDETVIDPELKGKLNIIIGDSHTEETKRKVIEQLDGKQIDFLFIDGDHRYEGVKRDFELYGSLVRKGGIIGFHDIMLNDPKWVMAGVEVCKAWNELVAVAGSKYYVFWDELGQGTGTGIYFKP